MLHTGIGPVLVLGMVSAVANTIGYWVLGGFLGIILTLPKIKAAVFNT